MTAAATTRAASTGNLLATFGAAVAADLSLLASLHGRELDAETARSLRRMRFPLSLVIDAKGSETESVRTMLFEEICRWPSDFPATLRDELAADYAAIYLNNYCNASPQESYWLDEDHLAWQAPMFAVREAYRSHGLEVRNWRIQADDHLTPQLEFVAWLLSDADADGRLAETAAFLDEHLLLWLEDFATRVARRCETPFYAGLALLSWHYVDALRNILAEILDTPRPDREQTLQRLKRERSTPEPVKFMPGVSESW